MANFIPRFWAIHWLVRASLLLMLGVACGLGQPPLAWWWLGIAAYALALPLIAAAPTWRAAGVAALLFGLGYFGYSLRWIVSPFLVDAATWAWAAPFAIVLTALRESLFWAVGAAFGRWVAPGRMMGVVLSLTLVEALRGYLFTGFPWSLIGHVLVPLPLAQLSATGGPHLLTLVTLTGAAGLALLLQRRWQGAVPLVLLAFVWLPFSFGAPPAPVPDAPIVRLVQPNAPQDEKWIPEQSAVFFRRLINATGATPRPDLIVWPETAVTTLLEYAQPELDLISDTAQGVPLITGLNRRDGSRFFNSLVVLGRGGRITSLYDKAHLVPFGEYTPFGNLLLRLGIETFASERGFGFTKGGVQPLIDLPGIGPARALICYEGIFAQEVATQQRPRLLVLITNDAWFGKDAGPLQHLAQARLRAIEQGLPMVRVANTGISAMIDARGRIIESLPMGVDGFIDVALPPALPVTYYVRWGDWPAVVGVLLGLLALTGNHLRRRGAPVSV